MTERQAVIGKSKSRFDVNRDSNTFGDLMIRFETLRFTFSVWILTTCRSVTSRMCVVRRTYSNYGDGCFAAAGPKLWNSLPADLRQADISLQKRLLKTFLFSGSEIAAHCD